MKLSQRTGPIFLLSLAGTLAVPVHVASAHEQTVHYRITYDALGGSVRFQDAVSRAGLAGEVFSPSFVDLASTAIGQAPWTSDPTGLVLAGSILEDGVRVFTMQTVSETVRNRFTVARVLNHFQDPSRKGLLPLVSCAAVDWALESNLNCSTNLYSYVDAVECFAQGIRSEDAADRITELGQAFVALGCSMHLIEDQFSPAHTRDDAHFPVAPLYSLLEVHGSRYIGPSANSFFAGSVTPTSLASVESYFDAAVGWTNSHFFSEDTIFEDYPLPSSRTTGLAQACAFPPPTAEYVTSKEPDTSGTLLASARPGLLAGTTRYEMQGVECIPPDSNMNLLGIPGIDRVIYDDLRQLVPRATNQAAGLLDYFFRGMVTVRQVDADTFEIRNDTIPVSDGFGHEMDGALRNGTLELLCEFPDGHRESLSTLALDAIGLQSGESVDLDATVPMQAFAGGLAQVWVLFEGDIGEDPGVVTEAMSIGLEKTVCGSLLPQWILNPVGDATGDGLDDLVQGDFDLGAPYELHVRLLRGPACTPSWERTFVIPYPGAGGVGGVGDVTGDGKSDVLAWYPDPMGQIEFVILDGPTGNSVYTRQVSLPSLDVSSLGDLTGDGRSEFALGIKALGQRVFDGASGTLLFSIPGDVLRSCDDLDGDGHRDICEFYGRNGLTFFDGTSGQPIAWPIAPEPPYDWKSLPGYVTMLGDLDGDSFPEVLGFQLAFVPAGLEESLVLLSGRTGNALRTNVLPVNELVVSTCGDYDGDGDVDLYTVAPGTQFGVYDAATGARGGVFLPALEYAEEPPGFGGLQSCGDLDGDRCEDYIPALFGLVLQSCIVVRSGCGT